MNYKKYLLISLIVALVISALIGIYIFLFSDGTETEMNVLSTTVSIGVFSLIGLCCATLQNRKGLKWLSILGVFAILDVLGTITTPLLNKLMEKK